MACVVCVVSRKSQQVLLTRFSWNNLNRNKCLCVWIQIKENKTENESMFYVGMLNIVLEMVY